MSSNVLQYVFWVLLALPVLALGVYFFGNITGSILEKYRDDEKRRKAKEQQKKRRQEFEESYSRRRGGRG